MSKSWNLWLNLSFLFLFNTYRHSQVVHNSALKEFLLSYLAHRERPPLLEKEAVKSMIKKGTSEVEGNRMADFDKKVNIIKKSVLFYQIIDVMASY